MGRRLFLLRVCYDRNGRDGAERTTNPRSRQKTPRRRCRVSTDLRLPWLGGAVYTPRAKMRLNTFTEAFTSPRHQKRLKRLKPGKWRGVGQAITRVPDSRRRKKLRHVLVGMLRQGRRYVLGSLLRYMTTSEIAGPHSSSSLSPAVIRP